MDAPYGPFRPDTVGPNSGFAETADGVVAVPGAGGVIGYSPLQQMVTPAGSVALPTAPRGGISLQLEDESWATFFGTDTTIQQLQTDFSFAAIATGLAPPTGEDFSFLHFGQYLLNTNAVDGLKAYNVEAPAGNNAVSGAPAAKSLYTSSNVVFALNCDGNDKRMKSTAQGDHTNWTTQGADGKTYEDGGALVCGGDLKNGASIQLQAEAARLVQFGGAPTGALYAISKISDAKGCAGARSFVVYDGTAYWVGPDAHFYSFDLGNGLRDIGFGKVDNWFGDQLDLAELANVQGAVDPVSRKVSWRWKRLTDMSTTVYETILSYAIGVGEFSTETVESAWLMAIAPSAVTADSLDAMGPIDSIDIPVDDTFWQGGKKVFAGLDGAYKYATFSGANQAATLETCPFNNPVTGLVGWATPIDDCPDGTLALGVSDSPDAAITYGTGAAKVSAGRVPLRGRGMNVQFQRAIPAGSVWTYANGIDHIKSSQGGPK